MMKSQRLRLTDLRDAYRLIGECREIAASVAVSAQMGFPWWRHMLEGLCPLVGAQVGIAGVFQGFGTTDQRILAVEELGWAGQRERACFLQYQADGGEKRDPAFRQFAQLHGRLITRSRDQLLDDAEWYGSSVYDDYLKPARIDGKIMSLCTLGGDDSLSHLLTIKRPPGERSFAPREMRLIHLFHHEFASALGGKLARPAPTVGAPLPTRLRQVLSCLISGDGEKQVALRLGLSVHTVHEHVKRLHRIFNVSSRGELLAAAGHADHRVD